MTNLSASGRFFIVAAPSGAGKTSLVTALMALNQKLAVAVSHTTRPIRHSEVDGVNYHFVDRARFEKMQENGEFLESATVFGNYYGTSAAAVDTVVATGRDVILEIDWQGARQIRAIRPEVVSIFILPPSLAALRARLLGRNQDDSTTIETRLAEAVNEIRHSTEFDCLIINDDFDTALAELNQVIQAGGEQPRDSMYTKTMSDFVQSLLSEPDHSV